MTAALDLVGVGDARPTSTAAPTTAVTACATDIVKLGQQPFDSTKDKDGEQSSGQEKRPDCTMADGKKPAPQKHLSLDAFLGRLGSWHMPIFVFGFLRGLPATMSMMYIVFSAPVHQRFWCADSGWANSTFSGGGGSRHDIDPTRDICDGSCRTFEFDRETYGYTIMEQYELVCQRSWLASAAQSLYLTGLMIGGVLNAHISDWWGRRVVIGISLVWTLVAATATTWAPSIEFFVVGRLLTACGVSGFAEAAFTLVVETVSPKARYMPTLTVGTGWSTGLLLLPLAAWLLKDWAVLQLFVAATVVPLIGIWFILPESPRWQLSMGRFDAAEQNLEKLVRRHPHLDKRDVQQLVDERRRATANGADLTGKRPTVATAFNRAYRRSTIVFSFCMLVPVYPARRARPVCEVHARNHAAHCEIDSEYPPIEKGGYNFFKGDYDQIIEKLSLVPWRHIFLNCETVDDMYNCFVSQMHAVIEEFIPKRTGKSKNNTRLREYISSLESLIENDASPRFATKLRRASRRLRVLEESNLDFKDSKSFFRYANKRLRGKEDITALKTSNTVITDDISKADAFKNFFSSVYVAQPGPTKTLSFSSPTPSRCPYLFVSEYNILKKINQLPSKCSLTPDCIPPLFYKRVAHVITEPLSLIYARSYEEGVVPDFFRQSVITPVHKKGSKSNVDNYRPVAQSSIACILFEKLLVDHIFNFMQSEEMLDEQQHGFTKGKSTATQLVEMVQDWAIYINKKKAFDCIYFDFSKAFDRVNHFKLLQKLIDLNIDKHSVLWISSYLTNRRFCVRVNNSFSQYGVCPSGVPQGSCLGPLLFCIFILDLKNVIPGALKHKLYADDLKLYGPSGTKADREILQKTIDSISDWCVKNDMIISVPKCAVVCLKEGHVYTLDGQEIPRVNSIRDLGVTITPELDFNIHITQTIQSASLICNMIFRCFIIECPLFYIRLYNSLVLPKFIYSCEVWRPYLKKHIDAIEKVQSKFLRRVALRCKVERSSLDLLPISERHSRADFKMYARISQSNRLPIFFNIRNNNLRSTQTISSKIVARSDRINNMFSWRMARMLRTMNS